MSHRPVYLDRNQTRTAADIKSAAECTKWIEGITRDIAQITRNKSLDRRQQSALYYKKRALAELNTRIQVLENSPK